MMEQKAYIVDDRRGKKIKMFLVKVDLKCPLCKGYSLIESHDCWNYGDGTAAMWDFECKRCGAKFINDKTIHPNLKLNKEVSK